MTASALVEETTKRSAVVWVSGAGAMWHVWHDGRAYVVAGGREQRLGDVSPGSRAVVAVRGRKGALLVQWVAAVSVVSPGSEEWDVVVPLLHAKRRNAPDGDRQPQRWARESVVLRLAPTGETLPVRSWPRSSTSS